MTIAVYLYYDNDNNDDGENDNDDENDNIQNEDNNHGIGHKRPFYWMNEYLIFLPRAIFQGRESV